MRIRTRFATTLATLLLLSMPASLAGTMKVTLHHPGTVNGVELKAGAYRLEVAPSMRSVSFYQGKTNVLSAPCRISILSGHAMGDSVFYASAAEGRPEIVRILLVDPKLVIDLADLSDEPAVAAAGTVPSRNTPAE